MDKNNKKTLFEAQKINVHSLESQYPYGEFPERYTKRGQQILQENINNNKNIPSNNMPQGNCSLYPDTQNTVSQQSVTPNMGNPALLNAMASMMGGGAPTVNIMGAEQTANTMANNNMANLYPLLMKMMDKNFDQTELLKGMLPNNPTLAPFMNMFLNKSKNNTPPKISSMSSENKIDTYTKIDEE